MLAGTDVGTGMRGHVGVWGGILLFSPTVWAVSGAERRDTHTHTHTHTHTREHTHTHTHTRTHTHTHTGTHTGTYTRMLLLPFSDLPLKKCSRHGQLWGVKLGWNPLRNQPDRMFVMHIHE